MAGREVVVQPGDHSSLQEHRPVLPLLKVWGHDPGDHPVLPTSVAGWLAVWCDIAELSLDLFTVVDLDDLERLNGAPIPTNEAELPRRPVELELPHRATGLSGNALVDEGAFELQFVDLVPAATALLLQFAQEVGQRFLLRVGLRLFARRRRD